MKKASEKIVKLALAGNPNVGKSTLFNALTGMNQHTGNWPGKTVGLAVGEFTYRNVLFSITDLPGTYSLISSSEDEAVARRYLCSGDAELVVIVADACCLARSLALVLQIRKITQNIILCVNLLDEAKKKKIRVDLEQLSSFLQIPVIGTAAREKSGLPELKEALFLFSEHKTPSAACSHPSADAETVIATPVSAPESLSPEDCEQRILHAAPEAFIKGASALARRCVSEDSADTNRRDRKIDRIITSRLFGFPIMLLLLALIFFLTIRGANLPSQLLSDLFAALGTKLDALFAALKLPPFLHSLLKDGLYDTLTCVIAVMLPPMAIFFPLFTLLEDLGFLPRIAFNMDRAFRGAGACGKQCLTMMMGFGCNACGVTGCRIIDSPREKRIAILTNSFVPCNGRFPTLIALISVFFIPQQGDIAPHASESILPSSLTASLLLTAAIVLSISATLLVSRLLSATILKGSPSSFLLELPPYRLPKVPELLVRSLLDRTVFVLGRAVSIAAPAGILIFLAANCTAPSGLSYLTLFTDALEPLGRAVGADGIILAALLLSFPANELFLPILLMAYTAQGTLSGAEDLVGLGMILRANGWTELTAATVLLLSLFHFPCGTTCLTIRKETGSLRWTLAAVLLPTALGLILCFLLNTAFCFFGRL